MTDELAQTIQEAVDHVPVEDVAWVAAALIRARFEVLPNVKERGVCGT